MKNYDTQAICREGILNQFWLANMQLNYPDGFNSNSTSINSHYDHQELNALVIKKSQGLAGSHIMDKKLQRKKITDLRALQSSFGENQFANFTNSWLLSLPQTSWISIFQILWKAPGKVLMVPLLKLEH